MTDFVQLCRERGFMHQCTDEEGLAALMHEQPIAAYIGFDCTAPSLHVGSLVQIMMLRWLQKCGHKPIVLMGGGTTKVGDPSGKDTARQMLSDEQIAANMAGIKRVFEKFLIFEKSSSRGLTTGSSDMDSAIQSRNDGVNNKAIMVNNDDWLKDLNYIELLRDYGRHFSVNRMISMESVKQRLERESHLSFLEFNYMVMQAYDFVELNRRYGCRLQIGGSDQWGNIVMGTSLHAKLFDKENEEFIEAFLNKERNIPIDIKRIDALEEAEKKAVSELNAKGIKVESFKDILEASGRAFEDLRLQKHKFLELDNEERRAFVSNVREVSRFMSTMPAELKSKLLDHARKAKEQKIYGLTSPLITTASGAKMGKTADGAVWLNDDPQNPDYSKSAYDYWQFWRNTEDADVGRFLRLFTELPLEEIAELEALEGAKINDAKIRLANEATTLLHGKAAAKEAADTAHKVFTEGLSGEALPEITIEADALQEGIPAFALFQQAGLADSNKKARQLIQQGGAKINDVKVEAEDYLLTAKDLMSEGHIKLSAGKKRHALVKFS